MGKYLALGPVAPQARRFRLSWSLVQVGVGFVVPRAPRSRLLLLVAFHPTLEDGAHRYPLLLLGLVNCGRVWRLRRHVAGDMR